MTKLSEKEQKLEAMTVEYSQLIKAISIAYKHGMDASKMIQEKENMAKEIDKLRKEVGYKSRDDFEIE